MDMTTTTTTTTTTTAIMQGACACNATTWKTHTPATNLTYCYCTQCQRTTGSPFGAWLGIPASAVEYVGPIVSRELSEIATRTFCGTCGGTLGMAYHCYPQKTYVAAGTVVEGVEKVPGVGCHLFVADKPVWYEIPDDGVRRWDGFDDEFVRVIARWRAEKEK